jgi:hypothetical protein
MRLGAMLLAVVRDQIAMQPEVGLGFVMRLVEERCVAIGTPPFASQPP